MNEQKFCAAADEWDHSWQVVEVKPDGTATEECSECQERVEDPFYDPGPNS